MLFSGRKLIGLAVKTKSGRSLGKVVDFKLDTDNLTILKVLVGPSLLINKIISTELIIDRSQIVEITNQMVVVEDGAIRGELGESVSV